MKINLTFLFIYSHSNRRTVCVLCFSLFQFFRVSDRFLRVTLKKKIKSSPKQELIRMGYLPQDIRKFVLRTEESSILLFTAYSVLRSKFDMREKYIEMACIC